MDDTPLAIKAISYDVEEVSVTVLVAAEHSEGYKVRKLDQARSARVQKHRHFRIAFSRPPPVPNIFEFSRETLDALLR